MRRDDPNLEYLLVVASALHGLCNEIVFVGGSVAGLLLTDPVAEGIRATEDVDAIVEATTLVSIISWKNGCRHWASRGMQAAR